jgi:hypothetical protein
MGKLYNQVNYLPAIVLQVESSGLPLKPWIEAEFSMKFDVFAV